ncbi:hypothetical protein CDL12_10838 [Handroanthus impetiginosus]|uniref:Uncharacterized protein n=1 Tax=Handroanthus impetiginosus TaxID=429701 RepID=A0A2G9HG54_9LAMI|nr:hypothetical protein CDL12_10838 [Handroanthus impetiginosus]
MDCCENPVAMGRVVCPKPCRLGPSNANSPSMMILRFHMRNDAESKPGAELLGPILRKEDLKAERCANLSSSPPFFFGSPPCRTPNPLVQDANFGVQKLTSMRKSHTNSTSTPNEHLGKQQAAVRVEGFDCQSSRGFAMS